VPQLSHGLVWFLAHRASARGAATARSRGGVLSLQDAIENLQKIREVERLRQVIGGAELEQPSHLARLNI